LTCSALVFVALLGVLAARPAQAEIMMGAYLEAVDEFGQPLSSIAVGQSFELCAYVTDLRSPPVAHPGVFSAYLRAEFSPSAFEALSAPDIASFFDGLLVAKQVHADLLLGGGGSTALTPPPDTTNGQSHFTVMLQAKQAGTHPITPAYFSTPDAEWLLYLYNDSVQENEVLFSPLSLRVVPEPSSVALGTFGLTALLLAARRQARRRPL
jgi:hypothetical protein